MIHPSAIIDADARLADDVHVGPFSIIGAGVQIGRGSRIGSHCVIDGLTTIGEDNEIFSFCAIGGKPQDKKYADEPTRLEIGDRNIIREYCSLSTGTVQDKGVTRIGHDNLLMAYVHIAHDCIVGNRTIFANNATLAGHVEVADWAILGGFTGVHQFVHVGAHSFCGVGTVLLQDLPPYVTVSGNPAKPHGINKEGLFRRGFTSEDLQAIKTAYRLLYRKGLLFAEAKQLIAEQAHMHQSLQIFNDFLASAQRGIVR